MFSDAYYWAIVFFLILQIVAAVIRVYVRAFLVRKFGADDIVMVLTLAFACAYDACILMVSQLTHDAPLSQIAAEGRFFNLFPATHYLVAGECLYIAGAVALKISLGLLLLRVLIRKWQKYTIYGIWAICCTYSIGYFFVALFACGNPKNYLENAVKRNCISNPAINGTSYTHAVLNAIADIIFACLPVAMLWNADMSRRAKFSVGGILVLGSVGCVFTIVRIPFVHYLSAVSETYFVTGRPIAMTSSGELSIGITCICLATYKPLFRTFFRRGDTYYDQGTVVSEKPQSPEAAQANASWTRASWQAPQRMASTSTRTTNSEQPIKYGPEYRNEVKTLGAHVEESPDTPASETPMWTGVPRQHEHRFSDGSEAHSHSVRSPV